MGFTILSNDWKLYTFLNDHRFTLKTVNYHNYSVDLVLYAITQIIENNCGE